MNRKNKNPKLLYSCFLIAFPFITTTAFAQDWVPVYEEPRHRLVFTNEQAMILDVNLPPGYVSLYHQHVVDLLYVTISGTKVWAEPLHGKKMQADVKTGDLRFSSDNHGLPHIHRVGNIGTKPFHVIGVGVRGDINGRTDPLTGDIANMNLVIKKPHASVYRITLQPGEKTGIHSHVLPFAEVYISAGKLTNYDEKEKTVSAGEFNWQESITEHQIENTGNEVLDFIEMQWH